MRRTKSPKTGFSLIELIIVLTIIGILSSITYPIYTKHLIKVRKIEAITTTLDIASQLEKYYAENHTYVREIENINDTKHYRFEITARKNTYLIKATPLNQQVKNKYGTLSIDHYGKRKNLDLDI